MQAREKSSIWLGTGIVLAVLIFWSAAAVLGYLWFGGS